MSKRKQDPREEQGPSTDGPSTPKKGAIQCYVHAVSPISNKDGISWFNMSLQSQSKVDRAVCFSPDKRAKYKDMEVAKCGVEIDDYDIQKRTRDIVISKRSHVKAVEKLSFDHDKKLSGTESMKLIDLHNLAPEQLIPSLKAHVERVDEAREDSRSQLKIQSIHVADSTCTMKIVLFGKHVGQFEEQKSYEFMNLRLKTYNNSRYLNTPKQDVFTFKNIPNLKNVAAFQLADPNKTITGTILGVNAVEKEAKCPSCKRKSEIKDGKVFCEPCDFKTSKTKASMHWFVRIRILSDGKEYRLAIRDFAVRDFITTCSNLSPNCTEQELEDFLLETDEIFEFTFDDSQNLISKIIKEH